MIIKKLTITITKMILITRISLAQTLQMQHTINKTMKKTSNIFFIPTGLATQQTVQSTARRAFTCCDS